MNRAVVRRAVAHMHTGRAPVPGRTASIVAEFARCFAKTFARCGAACAELALGACSLLPSPEAQQTYVLPASATPIAPVRAETPTQWSLRAHTPLTIAPLDSTQIIVQHPNASLAAYRGIRWADRAPALLRDRFTLSLNDSGLFAVVVSEHSTLSTDLALAMTLRSFQLMHPAGKASVHIQLDVQLIDDNGPYLLAHQSFAQSRAVADPDHPDAVIAAFGQAVDDVAGALAAWLEPLARQRLTPEKTQ